MLKKLQYEETMSQLHDWLISECRLTTPSCAKPQKYPIVLCLKTTSGVHWHNLMNAHWHICWWWSPTSWWRCPLAASLMLSRLSVWQPLVDFIDIFPPLSAERRDNLLQNIFELPPFKCRRVSLLYSLVQLHESTIIDSLFAALSVIVVSCRTETIVWLWMTIPKDRSIHNVSSIWLIFVGCDIFLRNDWACHNGNKDGDQNTNLPYDWFFDNENTSVGLQLQVACNSVWLQLS